MKKYKKIGADVEVVVLAQDKEQVWIKNTKTWHKGSMPLAQFNETYEELEEVRDDIVAVFAPVVEEKPADEEVKSNNNKGKK